MESELNLTIGGGRAARTSPSQRRGPLTRRTALLLLWLPIAVSAHHNPVGYDLDHRVELRGIIVGIEWGNPHIFLSLRSDEGVWSIEAQSPRVLQLFGWTSTSLKVGETVVASVHPSSRPAERRALGRSIQRADGSTLPIPWSREEIRSALREERDSPGNDEPPPP